MYKIAEGKKENKFSFNGEFLSKETAEIVALQAHLNWMHLISERMRLDNDAMRKVIEEEMRKQREDPLAGFTQVGSQTINVNNTQPEVNRTHIQTGGRVGASIPQGSGAKITVGGVTYSEKGNSTHLQPEEL